MTPDALRPTRRPRRGSNAVEFAFMLPLVAGTLAAVIEYGWYMFQQNAIFHSARDGVRLGVTFDAVDAPVEAAEHTRNILGGLDVGCDPEGAPDPNCAVGATVKESSGGYSYLEIRMAIDYEPITGLLPTPPQLVAQYAMVLENQSGG